MKRTLGSHGFHPLGLALLFMPLLASAREFHVDAAAKAGGDGAPETPCATIQAGLDLAQAGDTVRVHAGTYQERVRFKHSGTKEKPVVLQGEPGAIVDGSERWEPHWEPAPGYAEGVWRAKTPVEPAYASVDGLYLQRFFPDKLKHQERDMDSEYKGATISHTPKEVLAHGGPLHGWKEIKGLWCYQDDCLYGRVDGKEFGRLAVRFAPLDSACVAVDGTDYAVVRGLDLRHAWEAVSLHNTEGSVVEYCSAGPTMRGIRMDFGARSCSIRYCEVSCPALFAWRNVTGGNEGGDVWWAIKIVGDMNLRTLSALNAGANNTIAWNLIHHAFQGVEDKEDKSVLGREEREKIGDAPTSTNLEVHHNTIHDIFAYGLGPNGSCVNQRWHHNLIRDAGEGLRIKKPQVGPLYIYRNVILNKSDRTYWWYARGEDRLTAAVYMYHNTLQGGGRVVFMTDEVMATAKQAVMFGNIMLMEAFWHHKQDPKKCCWQPWQCDGNLVWESVQKEALQRSAYNAHGVTVADKKLPYDERFVPTADSPALDAAPDAEQILKRAREAGIPAPPDGVFPGLESHAGKGADMGALESDPEGKLPPEFTTVGLPPGQRVGAEKLK